MRIVRYQYHGHTGYGLYQDESITPITGDLFGAYTVSAVRIPFAEATLLAPIIPRQLIAIGLNYHDHVGELDFAKKLPK